MPCGLFDEDSSLNWWLLFCIFLSFPLLKWLIVLAYQLAKQFISPISLSKYFRKDGESWAVVTGATDGIGLGFCQVLVDLGFNVVLVSRNPDKLKATVEALEKRQTQAKKEVKIKTIVFNFKDSSDPVKYEALLSSLKELDIALFVNNVGTSDAKFFHDFSHQQIVEIININCVGMAALSSDVLAMMKKRDHKSALINLSSFMEETPLPFLGLYSATKAFNKNLTEGLHYEYPEVDIMCLKPMFVQTPLSKQKKGLTVPDRRQCARDSLMELQWESETYGHISHRIVGSSIRNLAPKWLSKFMIGKFAKRSIKKLFPKVKFD